MRSSWRNALVGFVFLLMQWLAAAPVMAALSITPASSTDGSYTVTWTKPANASLKTRLHEKVGSGSWSVVGTYAWTVTSKAFSGKAAGTYSYKTEQCFTAFGSTSCWDSEGPASVTVSATPARPPATPAKPGVTAGNTHLSVSWTAPAANGSAITDYDVRYKRTSASSWTSHAFSGAGTGTSITGLTNGTEYEVQVKAHNAAGASAWSAGARGTPTSGASMTVSPATSTDGAYTVSWVAPRCFNVPFGGGRVCQQLQERSGAGNRWSEVSGVGTAATSHAFSGKAAGTYHYRLTLGTVVTAGPVSVTVGPPPRPTASLAWTPSMVDYGGSSTLTWSSTDATGCTLNGVARATSGRWLARERTATRTDTLVCTGPGGTSPTVNATLKVGPPPPDLPDAPARPTLSAVAGQISAAWTAPADNGSAITGYRLRYRRGAGTWQDAVPDGTATRATITGLAAGTYTVHVGAQNAAGWSKFSPGARVEVPAADVPAAPAAPTVATGTGQLTVSWDAPADNGAAITNYRVRHKRNLTRVTTWNEQTLTGTEAALGSLTNGLEYAVTVAAYNSAGWSAESDTVTGAPLAAPVLSGPASSTGSHTLTWSKVTGVTHYTIRERKDAGAWTASNAGAGTSEDVSGKGPGRWAYQAAACNGGGCGDWSNTVTVTVTEPPLYATPSPSTDGSYTVHWQAGAGTLQLRERYEDGNWTVVGRYARTTTSKAFTGKPGGTYAYRTYQCSTYIRTLCVTPVAGPVSVDVTGPVPAKPATPTATAPTVARSYTVSWAAVTHATRYELQGSGDQVTWTSQYDGAALNAALSGQAAGERHHRLRACNGAVCGDWSGTLTLTVPGTPPLSVSPSPSTDGDYTVSWTGVRCFNVPFGGARVCRVLQERVGDAGTWTDVAGVPETATSHAVSKTVSDTYYYRLVIKAGMTETVVAGPVSVEVDLAPAASIEWNPNPVAYGGDATLTWRGTNVTGCLLNGADRGLSGTWEATNLTQTRTDTLVCSVTDTSTVSDSDTLEVRPPIPAAPTATAPDTTGSYTVSWTAVANGERYTLREKHEDADDWTLIDVGKTVSKDFTGKAEGDWTYQVIACDASDLCSAEWSGTRTVTVPTVPLPARPGTPTASAPDTTGNYTVRWVAVATATRYALQESRDKATWASQYDGAALSEDFTGKAAGEWHYRVRACHDGGCGNWSEALTVTVPEPPSGLSVHPSPSPDGAYTVSWPAPAPPNRWTQLWERLDRTEGARAWTRVGTYGRGTTSKAFTGKPVGTHEYSTYLCRVDGSLICDPAEGPVSVTVTGTAPDTPAGLTGPAGSTGEHTISWQPVTGATRYELRAQKDQGAPTTHNTGTATRMAFDSLDNGNWHYQVRACNGPTTCSEWSATLTVVVGDGTVPDAPNPARTTAESVVPATESINADKVGTLAGEFRVAESGAATYRIGIPLPPGTAGATPPLGLHYNSQRGNGLAGVGWSIDGLSAITRCRQTYAQDGKAQPLRFNEKDRFCLDGARLLLTDDSPTKTYGAANSEYKTEIDGFLTVTAKGGTTGKPDYFEVARKDGSVSTYGGTGKHDSEHKVYNRTTNAESDNILTWALQQVKDSAGNKIRYDYTADANGHRINKISYAYGATNTPRAEVRFSYDSSRKDNTVGYLAGYKLQSTQRLHTITVYGAGTAGALSALRNYRLRYATHATDTLSRLAGVKECVESGTSACLPETRFTWSAPATGFEDAAAATLTLNTDDDSGWYPVDFTPADLNGDGHTDLVWTEIDADKENHRIQYALADPANGDLVTQDFTGDRAALQYGDDYHDTLRVHTEAVDYNADGRLDIIVYSTEADLTKVHLSTPRAGGGWRLDGAGIDLQFNGRHRYADLDADGLTDAYRLVAVDEDNNELPAGPTQVPLGYHLEVRYLKRDRAKTATSDRYYKYGAAQTLSVPFTQLAPTPPPPGTEPTYYLWKTLEQADLPLADVDGDGRADLVTWGTSWANIFQLGMTERRLEVFRQTDTGFERYGRAAGLVLTNRDATRLPKGARLADLNRDGLTDLMYFVGKWYRKSRDNYQWTGNWHYRLSTGAGFADAVQLTRIAAGDQAPRSPSLVDDNGDGYPDFLYHDVPDDRLRVRYWSPEHGAFETTTPTRLRRTDGEDDEAFFTVDMNGDGNGDLLHVPKASGSTETLKVYHHNTTGRPHLITTVTNGLGARTQVAYESLGATDNYVRIADLHSTPEREECFSWDFGAALRVRLTRLNADGDGGRYCWTEVESTLQDADAFYTALNDPWADPKDKTDPLTGSLTDPLINTAGEAPILELMGPLYVVTQVHSSAPTAANAKATSGIGYVYERGKVQAAGRGLLGFRTLTTVDLQTGVRTATTYRQDFPYIGLPLRTEVRTASGKLLRAAQNTWKLKGYDSARNVRTESSGTYAGTGSARLGALQPYIETSVEEVYDLPAMASGTEKAGAKLSTVTTVTAVDDYGNPTNITATTQDHAGSKRFQQVTENTYGAASDTWAKEFGRLTKTTVTRQRNETANSDSYDADLTATRTASFTYYTSGDKKGLLETEVREPDNPALKHTTTYDYDDFGNRVKAKVEAAASAAADSDIETRCDHNTREYDDYGRFVEEERDCLNRVVGRMGAYNAHGLPTQSERVVDRGGTGAVRTEYSYTLGGRLYFSRRADGAWTGTVWKACGAGCPTGAKYYRETRQPGNGTAGEYRVSREYRDALDRVVRTETKGFAEDAWIRTDTDYDSLGRVARQSAPYHAGQQQYWTTYSYDLLGRVVRTELPDYQAGSVNSVITVSYAGQVTTTTNGKGQTQTETRNALGEVTRTADHAGTTVTHSYDAWGQVVKTTTDGTGVDPVTVSMTYDQRGRRTATNDPDRGRWAYEYNGFDELVKQTDAVGNVQKMTYDGLGRLKTRKDYTPGATMAAATATWTYDPANGLGQLSTVTDGTYTRTHSYDSLGRLDTTTHALGGTDGTYYSKQTYDEYGRVHQVFDAARTDNAASAWNDNVVEVHYNKWGYAHQWTDGVHVNDTPRKTYRTITAQDARGNVTGEKLGAGAVRTARAFNARTGRISSITSEDVLDRGIQALTHDWDLVGNLTSRGETSVGKMLEETFTYDTLNRLTGAQVTGRSAQTVSYDALGNIKTKTGVGSYTYGAGTAGPHAVTRAGTDTYTYDANGNQLTGAGRTLTYHPFNKVKSIVKGTHTTAFVYGPERTRYKRTDVVSTGRGASTTTTLYLGNVEKVIAPDRSYTYKRYITGGVLIEQTHDTSGNRTGESTCYLLYDHLGSVDVITNAAGTVVQDMSFDAWGQRRSPDDWTVLALLRLTDTSHGSKTPYGFTGHEMLDAVGIIHMNGRIYDPRLGRFMQADPIIQFPDYSQSWNRYSYVLNNPLNATDPSGYILGIVGGIFGGAIGFFTCGPPCAVKGAAIGAGLGASAEVLVHGGSLGQALLAGVSAAAFTYAAGGLFPGMDATFGQVLLYGLQMGVVGGITTTLQGGNFGNGFVAAGTAALVGGTLAQSGWFRGLNPGGQLVTSMVAGGTVSRITGGKFANGAMTAAFAFLVNRAAYEVLGRAMVSAGAGAGIADPDPDALRAELDALVEKGVLSSERTFMSADDAAREVLNATAPLSQKYGLEVGGSIYSDSNGAYRYALPEIGGPGSVSVSPDYMGYHTHPSGKLRFSNQFFNYTGDPGISDMGWMAASGKALYLGVQINNAVRIGVCSPGDCYNIGRTGTDPGRVLQ